MKLNRFVVGNILLGVSLIVGGGAVNKYLDQTAGAALVAAGGLLLGWLLKQPEKASK